MESDQPRATQRSSWLQAIRRFFQTDPVKSQKHGEAHDMLLDGQSDGDRRRRHSAPSRSASRSRHLSEEPSGCTPRDPRHLTRSLSHQEGYNLPAGGPELTYRILKAYPTSKQTTDRAGCTSPACACVTVKQYTAELEKKADTTLANKSLGTNDGHAEPLPITVSDVGLRCFSRTNQTSPSSVKRSPQVLVQGASDDRSPSKRDVHLLPEKSDPRVSKVEASTKHESRVNMPKEKADKKSPPKKSTRTNQTRSHTSTECCSTTCACGVIKEYTANLLNQDRENKRRSVNIHQQEGTVSRATGPISNAASSPTGIKKNSFQPSTKTSFNEPGIAISRHESDGARKSTKSPSVVDGNTGDKFDAGLDHPRGVKHESEESSGTDEIGCHIQGCACRVVKEYTAKMTRADAERRSMEQRRQRTTTTTTAGPQSSTRSTKQPANMSNVKGKNSLTEHIGNLASENHLKMMDETANVNSSRGTQKRQAHKLKKPKHKTKRVFLTRGPFRKKSGFVKYKSLVEFRQSMTDIQRATLQEWETKHEKKKDRLYFRTKEVQHGIETAFQGGSTHWKRRSCKKPYFSSYPKGKSTPPLPALMNRLPNPPPGFT